MEIFYSNNIGRDELTLSEEESIHCIRVLRHKNKDIVKVSGGDGNLYKCEIIDDNVRGACLKILSIEGGVGKHNYFLHVAVAPTKNIDRFEWFLEKSTEIGIDQITPLLCERSERKIIKDERCQKVVISAAKQSLKCSIPHVNALTPFKELVNKLTSFDGLKLIAHCDSGERILLMDILRDDERSPKRVAILIGPEGDFSQHEIDLAIENGFVPVSLGDSRLRTETAALMSAAAMYYLESLLQPSEK